MKSKSLEFATLAEKYSDGETLNIPNAELLHEFEKGAKCLSIIITKTFEDQAAAICACTDATCAQRELAVLDELITSASDINNIGPEDADPALKALLVKEIAASMRTGQWYCPPEVECSTHTQVSSCLPSTNE